MHLPVSLLLMLLLLSPLAAEAADEREYAAAQFTYDYLFLVEALIRHERYPEAREELDGLLGRVEDDYEKALVHQTYGYVAIGLNDYPGAIGHFQRAIDSGALPSAISHNLRYTTAQLHLQEARPGAALKLLERWFADEQDPPPESRVLLGQTYYALGQPRAAIRELKRAIAQATEVQESWYQLLVGIYLESERLKPAAELLKKMLGLFPQKKIYWQQYAAVLMLLERYRDATAVLALAAEKGVLQQAGLVRLARLYLQQNLPLNAAELLSREMAAGQVDEDKKNLSLLADAWLLAREHDRALKVLEQLSAMDESGQADLRAGFLLMEQEQWRDAAEHLQRGLRRQAKPAAADWLQLGAVYVRLEEFEKARAAFQAALDSAQSSQHRQQAERWLAYLAAQ